MDSAIIDWLLEGDPSIQFQTKRDLLEIPSSELEALQLRIQIEGWGRKFLSLQNENGLWGGGIYTPKWISTHYTLMTLMRLELPPTNAQARKACLILLDKGFYKDGGINHFVHDPVRERCKEGLRPVPR